MKQLLILFIAVYFLGGWLLPLLGLAVLAPFQFVIAAILVGWAFKIAKAMGWVLLMLVAVQIVIYLFPGLWPF